MGKYYRFLKSNRLQRSSQFKKILNDGEKVITPYFILFHQSDHLDQLKVGFITSKKLGNAIVRNRIRRRLKESFRINQLILKKMKSIVFIGRKSVWNCSWDQLNEQMKKVLIKI